MFKRSKKPPIPVPIVVVPVLISHSGAMLINKAGAALVK